MQLSFLYFVIVIIVAIFVGVLLSRGKNKNRHDYSERPSEAKKKAIGERGEQFVSNILGKNIDGKQYVINNLLFEDKYGNSCQIDHVLINQYGIWIIETKNFAGKIIGKENAREWLHYLGNEKFEFYNPVMQNATHIDRLTNYIKKKSVFHNIVVFMYDADISGVRSDHVCGVTKLRKILSDSSNKSLLSPKEMEKYYSILMSLKQSCSIDLDEHIENIKSAQYKIQNNICPRCGGKLVLRKGNYGKFYGCENYPKCKFTKEIK